VKPQIVKLSHASSGMIHNYTLSQNKSLHSMEMVYNYILNGNVVTRKFSSLSFINNNMTYSHSKQQRKLEKMKNKIKERVRERER
jgi:hypothetical protein